MFQIGRVLRETNAEKSGRRRQRIDHSIRRRRKERHRICGHPAPQLCDNQYDRRAERDGARQAAQG